MAWRWFTKWRKPCTGQYHRLSDTEALAAQHASLYLLPDELLFIICQYLTPGEVVTLMLTCTRFWNSRTGGTGVFASIWQQMTSPVEVDKKIRQVVARYYVLRMLEYDGLLQRGSPSKYCCWECKSAHKREDFSSKELKKKVDLKTDKTLYFRKSARRSCALKKRYIWFGVCREMSFAQLRRVVFNPHLHERRANDSWIRIPDRNSFFFEDCSSLDVENRWLVYAFPLAQFQDVSSFALFERHARIVKIPLCPHLRTCDSEIIELYNQFPRSHTCKYCATTVQIEIIFNCVLMKVFRYVGLMLSAKDPTWMAQSYQERPRKLRAYCRAFLNWYGRQYGFFFRRPRRTFKGFKAKEVRWPFKGVAFCAPNKLPEKGPTNFEDRFQHPYYAAN